MEEDFKNKLIHPGDLKAVVATGDSAAGACAEGV